MTNDLTLLTATEALARIRRGELAPVDLASACLERVANRDSYVRAWSHVDGDQVLAQAAAAKPGPLFGVPIGIKDVVLTRDLPTQYNSPIRQNFHPQVDAACVEILRAAGAVIFGKTDTVEFGATGRPAATRNPHNFDHTPGGSSSGSAAAVADRHVPIAIGTQTGGSMMRPASYCGVWAIKPTWNLISNEGVKRFAPSLDTLGWFARSALDLRLLLDVFDPEPKQSPGTPLELNGATIAMCRTATWQDAAPSTQAAMAHAAERLRAAGAHVVDLDLPAMFGDLVATQKLIMRAEGRATFLAEYRAHFDQLGADFRAQVENQDGYTPRAIVDAYNHAALCRIAFDEIAANYDAVLTPSSVGEAPIGLTATGPYTFNAMWSLLHTPCVNVPGFTGERGLPVGLTVTGARYADRHVLATAEAMGAIFTS